MTLTDFYCLTPFIILAIAPIMIMITIAVIRSYDVVYSFTVLALIAALASIFIIAPAVPHVILPLLIIDPMSLFFLGAIILSALLVTLISYDYIRQIPGVREEYYIILFTSTLGAALLTVASHFIIFFLGIETLSISLYILIAFQKTRDRAVEAGLKYLILASGSTAFLLFGMGLIYAFAGSMEFSRLAAMVQPGGDLPPMILFGLAMILMGVGFKLALVPFHMWTPDVYQGAPAPVTAYIATVSKGAVMAVLIRFFFSLKGYDNHYFFLIISAVAILTMFAGNLLALQQNNLKRLLAYSSIANMGYLIIILLTGNDGGIKASVFFLISYMVTTTGAFGVVTILSSCRGETEWIAHYRGLFWRHPWMAMVLTFSLLSLAGIPLTAGFIGKFYVILEGVRSGLWLLILSMIINSVIGLYYYLRVITALFSPVGEQQLARPGFTGRITLFLITAALLILGIYPVWLFDALDQFMKF